MAWTASRSKAVVLLFLNDCLVLLPLLFLFVLGGEILSLVQVAIQYLVSFK